ncbi:MAG: type II secretion system major pseudopilin GspG [Epsilonproteobacteria bacterium]|nr:type II secretion system major pseudopilin GspG [Campylobacterota bacterium]
MIAVSGAPRQGFSLMEILIAIAILGLVGGLLIPKLAGVFSGAQVDTAKQSLRGLKSAIEMFHLKVGDYPDSLKDLYKKPANEELARDWAGPYIEEKKLVDPWKTKFQYTKTPGQAHPFELYSYGPKKKAASKDERIDVWAL